MCERRVVCIIVHKYIQDTHAHKLVLYISFVEVHTYTDIKSIGLGQSLIDTSGQVHRSVLTEVSIIQL